MRCCSPCIEPSSLFFRMQVWLEWELVLYANEGWKEAYVPFLLAVPLLTLAAMARVPSPSATVNGERVGRGAVQDIADETPGDEKSCD